MLISIAGGSLMISDKTFEGRIIVEAMGTVENLPRFGSRLVPEQRRNLVGLNPSWLVGLNPSWSRTIRIGRDTDTTELRLFRWEILASDIRAATPTVYENGNEDTIEFELKSTQVTPPMPGGVQLNPPTCIFVEFKFRQGGMDDGPMEVESMEIRAAVATDLSKAETRLDFVLPITYFLHDWDLYGERLDLGPNGNGPEPAPPPAYNPVSRYERDEVLE